MTVNKKNNNLKNAFSFCGELLKDCKLKVVITSIFIVIAILTGLIVALRTHSYYKIGESYGVVDIASGGLTTTFFARFFSMLLIAIIMWGCSFFSYLYPIAIIFLGYRAYLLGLNITLMIVVYGFSGIIVSLIVALPCQILALAVLSLFYLLMAQTKKDYKCFGVERTPKQNSKLIISVLILLFIICILESLLLWLFSAKIILVI